MLSELENSVLDLLETLLKLKIPSLKIRNDLKKSPYNFTIVLEEGTKYCVYGKFFGLQVVQIDKGYHLELYIKIKNTSETVEIKRVEDFSTDVVCLATAIDTLESLF